MKLGEIKKVCVIGAGTMGGSIAAHLVNLGFEVSLLDVTQEEALAGADKLRQTRPPAFYLPERISEVRVGNISEHTQWASEADWVCEAIVERLEAKQSLFARLEPILKPDALISSNSSSIPIASLVKDRSELFQQRFMGIHFFNPPRYINLLELIPTAQTDAQLVKDVTGFLECKVARRVVVAKDVPGFIGNRYGMWCLYHAIHVAEKLGLSVEEVDAITGTFLGRPETATFRLADITGLDSLRDIGFNIRSGAIDDPLVSTFDLPKSVTSMLARGWVGDKMGHGYYRREGKETLVLDLKTFAYRMSPGTEFPDIARLGEKPLVPRIVAALTLKSEVGEFLREYLIPILRCAEALKKEVCFSIADFDRVMKSGFGWELGPFEWIDAIGAKALGIADVEMNYRLEDVRSFSGSYVPAHKDPDFAVLEDFKEIARGATFRVRDLGGGVMGIVLTTKMGIINPQVVSELTGVFKEKFDRYVFASEAKSFSAGYDLNFVQDAIVASDFDRIEMALDELQALGELMQAKSGAAAIYGYCLGAGLELALSCHTIVAVAETQIGLPETRVGLIPSGRGVALMKQNNSFNAKRLAEVTVTMAQGTIAANADAARQLGYLRSGDKTVYNPDRLIHTAKEAALAATPLVPETWTTAVGPLVGMIDEGITKLRAAGTFTEYDELIAGKLRQILARSTSYQDALAKEKLEFLDLCKRTLSQTRIRHVLDHQTYLRN